MNITLQLLITILLLIQLWLDGIQRSIEFFGEQYRFFQVDRLNGKALILFQICSYHCFCRKDQRLIRKKLTPRRIVKFFICQHPDVKSFKKKFLKSYSL